MAAATVNIPAIALSVGPMLNGWYKGERTGSGTIVWKARELLAAGEIDYDGVHRAGRLLGALDRLLQHDGHGDDDELAGRGARHVAARLARRSPRPTATGQMRLADRQAHRRDGRARTCKPSDILTREAFENAIVVNSAIGGSTNAPIHLNAIARHIGVELTIEDWETMGYDMPLLVNLQPAGEYLGEDYLPRRRRAGGASPSCIRPGLHPRRRADRQRQDHRRELPRREIEDDRT